MSSLFSSQERDSSLDLEVTERRKFEVVPSPIASSSNPWVPIIPSPPTRAPHPHFDLSLHSGSSSSKDHLPRSRQASHQEVPKRQQYQDHPPKIQDRPKGPPRKRPSQLWRSRRKPAPRRQIKLVLERQKPLINLVPKINQLVPKINQLVPKWNVVPKSNLVPKRRQTAKLPSPPAPRSKAAASKSLRSPPQPKRFVTNISNLYEDSSLRHFDSEIVK